LDEESRKIFEQQNTSFFQKIGWKKMLLGGFATIGVISIVGALLYQKRTGSESIVPAGLSDWLSGSYARLSEAGQSLVTRYLKK
jgi:hypothetical protein